LFLKTEKSDLLGKQNYTARVRVNCTEAVQGWGFISRVELLGGLKSGSFPVALPKRLGHYIEATGCGKAHS
jgi:hypothetical protein